MIKCNDCGGSISSSASKCPKCGAVTEAAIRADDDTNALMVVILIIGLVGGGVFFFLYSNH